MSGLFGKEVRDHLKEILEDEDGWSTTEDLVKALDKRDCWGDFASYALSEAKKALVRRLVKTLRTEDGHSEVQSIEIVDTEGGRTRIYKQESLFKVEDYRQVCAYYQGRVTYFQDELNGLRERCKERHGVDPLL